MISLCLSGHVAMCTWCGVFMAVLEFHGPVKDRYQVVKLPNRDTKLHSHLMILPTKVTDIKYH